MMRAKIELCVAAAMVIAVAGCRGEGQTTAVSAPSASATAAATAGGAATAGLPTGAATSSLTGTSTAPRKPDLGAAQRPGIKTNYDGSQLPPDPFALSFCVAVHELPILKKAECVGAKSPGIMTTPMCIQTLTAALKIGKIQLDPAAITACEVAMKAATADCSFAKSFGMPLPAACDGIITGTLARGDACRSSLECAAGMQCFGVGPSDLGRCTPPAPRGATCGTGVDALATYTRQFSAERTRPACEGYCRLNRCQDFHALGEECQADVQCGPGAKCAKAKCTKA